MARPAAPPAAMARPAAPPAMARPAAPAFRAAPAPQRPAMTPHVAPRIAAPPRPAAPHVAGPRPEIHRAAPPQRPAMTRHPEPRIAAPRARAHRPLLASDRRERNRSKRVRSSVSSVSSSDSKWCRSGSVTCCRAKARSGRAASTACSSACSNCSRKSRKVSGRNARRKGCCKHRTACSSASSACSRPIRRACSGWHHRLRLNELPLCRLPHAGALPRSSAAMMPCKPEPRSRPGRTAGLPAMPGGAAIAPRLWPGSARCSGPTPIPTSSVTPSGPMPMTTAIGPMLTMTSSTRCFGVPTARIPLTPDIRNLALRSPIFGRAEAQA